MGNSGNNLKAVYFQKIKSKEYFLDLALAKLETGGPWSRAFLRLRINSVRTGLFIPAYSEPLKKDTNYEY